MPTPKTPPQSSKMYTKLFRMPAHFDLSCVNGKKTGRVKRICGDLSL
jgi:hypothetical protein